MANKALPNPEVIRQLLRYEPDTGKLFWLERPLPTSGTKRHVLGFNTKYAGKEALSYIGIHGYKCGNLMGKGQLAHRIAWVIYYGEWPSEVDHIDGDRSNNRIDNLRCVTHAQNMANSAPARGSSSKYLGVYYDCSRALWAAEITKDYRKKYIGRYKTQEEAALAYDEAAIKIHGRYARLNFSKPQPSPAEPRQDHGHM